MKKHLLVLPGNSQQNQAWGERMASHYAEHFDSITVAEYEHWKTGDDEINLLLEEDKLRSQFLELEKDTVVFILAKSAGSILAFQAIQSGAIHASYCVFFGIPFEWAATDVFSGNWSSVASFSLPALAFHNAHDPIAPYEYTKAMLERHAAHVSFVTTTGDDHVYDDYSVYDAYLLTLFARPTPPVRHHFNQS